MPTAADLVAFLEGHCPPELSEEWDNTGLLLGRQGRDIARVLTCLTLTPDVAQEAIETSCDAIVTHHPILFRPVQSITDADPIGTMLLDLLAAGVVVYSPHTSYDSARDGINQQLADRLELTDIRPIRPLADSDAEHLVGLGSGRIGRLPEPIPLGEFCRSVNQTLGVSGSHLVGDPTKSVQTVGIACGAAAEFLKDVHRLGGDVLLTGEARFHDALDARHRGIGLVLPGHYATERHALETLADVLNDALEGVTATASKSESDPLTWVS